VYEKYKIIPTALTNKTRIVTIGLTLRVFGTRDPRLHVST